MITIFSKPIHSGKTTELLNWSKEHNNSAGILMPDIDGQRYFFDIKTQQNFIAQCNQVENEEQKILSIGKYFFYEDAFEKANQIIIKSINSKYQTIIIDEVGKLELQEKGFHLSIKFILQNYATTKKNLLLVIRDSLLKEVIEFYKLKDYQVIQSIKELQ